MKYIILLSVTALLLIRIPVRGQHSPDEKDIDSLLKNYAASIDGADTTLAGTLFSKSQPVSFIHPRGDEKGWPQIRDQFYGITMGQLLSNRKLVITERTIHLLGKDHAWVEFHWDFNATLNLGHQPLHTRGRESQVLTKEKGRWKIVHIHYSSMPVSGSGQGF